ncbi:MAG: methyltransferase domain-containing protein [Rhodospirillaceae bacterium]|nr:MAG: methyltransferase domain-containing protein [Rhodospirillaceae bacterium]
MTAPAYNAAFYDRAEQSQLAARTIVPIIRSFTTIASVLDVGCARGTWLAAWVESGCTDYMGVDGASVRRDQLVIDETHFVTTDLSSSFDLGRRFDFVQCLEVAEHLPCARSAGLVANLVNHADVILFSAAPPGQGGEFHVNEQRYDFWRALFAAHGYVAFDCLRPKLRGMKAVPFWYRYNPILYVKSEAVGKLSALALDDRLAPDTSIPDVAPLAFRARKALIRLMPAALINTLARLNARLT